ncbi:hypothetical protein L7F22_051928 [Adiantum nelumboides]|nr:hypothetical protein [Adiantum nelumboides]
MEQEEKEHEDHGKRMHRKQGQVCSPEAKLHQSAIEREKRLAGCEKLESPDNTIDSSFSHMVLDRNLASQHISERRLKAPVMLCFELPNLLIFGSDACFQESKLVVYFLKFLKQVVILRLSDKQSIQLPPGYVEMDEEEKSEVLKALRENKNMLEKKLGALPLVCDTPSQIRARSNMDLELQGIEDAIKRFSRPHVYISLND